MKRLATACFVLLSFSVQAQTLFHYGQDSVSVKEFLRAYEKNNTGIRTEKAIRDYLDLYITSRLKVKEAYARGYDTLPQLAGDLENLRQQILPAYLNDKETLNRLAQEAFQRSQKDIHLAHIFIGMSDPGAKQKAEAALAELNGGKAFAQVAAAYSNDPSAKSNGGDLGWITAFSLPYELENLAYHTPAGKLSPVYASKAGYHIFKNLGERRDVGKIKAAQILLAFPPDADASTRQSVKKLADSLYSRILKGDDFGKLAAQFSNDVISAAANGQMPEFGIGQYEQDFEGPVFALNRDGEVTAPFVTAHGYHIVKRLSKSPVSTVNNEKTMLAIQSKVEQSDRIQVTRKVLSNKILGGPAYRKAALNLADLFAYSDSVFNARTPGRPLAVGANSLLFSLGDKPVTVADWISYGQTFRYKADGTGIKAYPVLWEEFQETMAVEYYQNHLEEYNEEFRQQLAEFRDGNLFFEIMQREVWGPAQTDSLALLNYFRSHGSQYQWKNSADAVVFYASDAASATTFLEQLKKSPAQWNSLVTSFSEKIAADSSRFELSQLPNPTGARLKPGLLTGVQVNKADQTASFAYIVKLHPGTEPRQFEEARGLVINDYQNELETKWVNSLKARYPVRIHQDVLNSVLKRKKR